MSADQDERAEIIFYDALQQPAAEREAYVHEVCGEDVALRKEVNALLQDHGAATGFLSAPAAAVITPEFDRPMREDVGDVIGNYKLLEQIGEGGRAAGPWARRRRQGWTGRRRRGVVGTGPCGSPGAKCEGRELPSAARRSQLGAHLI